MLRNVGALKSNKPLETVDDINTGSRWQINIGDEIGEKE